MDTPSTTAISITTSVATRVMASVIIVSFHSPVPKMIGLAHQRGHGGRQPPRTYATDSSTRAITHQGDRESRSCSGLISQFVTSFFTAMVKVPNVSTNQFVKSLIRVVSSGPLIHFRTGVSLTSGNSREVEPHA